ncbi:helix-turn-helix domain-containing protein [Saccharopolyspora sp. NPDC050389]|uniref:PucR family transcriptional regulator n=1 Tax=Saccharopolyspora sp. NPDC050389 TaxID=3155516 RepID=UPI0033F55CB1
MRNIARMREESLPRWKALLEELRQREHLLVESLMQQLEHGARFYAGLVDAAEFRNTSTEAFRYLLGMLADGRPPRHLTDLPREIGIRRAEQHVSLENVVSTVRGDFTALWSTLLWISRATDMPVLIAHVDDLWQVVDDFATEIQVSYLRGAAARADLDQHRQRAMISALFSSSELNPGLVRQIAGTLGVPEAEPFDVVVSDHADRDRLDAFVISATGHGSRIFTADVEDCAVAFWQSAPPGEGPDDRLGDLRCGRSRVPALSELPAGARTALRVLRALPPEVAGPASVADVWDRLAATYLLQLDPALLESARERLATCPASERERLVETARSFASTGSIAATAKELFCHRNTVVNRLRRLRELTALDMTVPQDAALLSMLLSLE